MKPIDAIHWLAADLHFINISWLNERDHDTCLTLPADEYSELYSFGKEGYLSIFVLNC